MAIGLKNLNQKKEEQESLWDQIVNRVNKTKIKSSRPWQSLQNIQYQEKKELYQQFVKNHDLNSNIKNRAKAIFSKID